MLWAYYKEKRNREEIQGEYEAYIASVEDKISLQKENNESIRKDIGRIGAKVKYVALKPFEGDERDGYVKFLAQMAVRPEWIYFMWSMEQNAVSICKGNGNVREQLRSIAWLEAFDLICNKLTEHVMEYNEIIESARGDDEGQISLS
jgi:hypothetical protein